MMAICKYFKMLHSQPIARLDAIAGYVWSDAMPTQPGPIGKRSIDLVGMPFGRTFAVPARKACY